ncbi:MAG TPA: hypothetical protein VN736_29475 [Candidatus Limnocylindrales bacterium]|nr:hypothetical protein [Candidatus Limnocylindrales bacterium]
MTRRHLLKLAGAAGALRPATAILEAAPNAAAWPHSVAASVGNARVHTDGDQLVVTTGRITRSWIWTGHGLATIGLRNEETGTGFSLKKNFAADWSLPGALDDAAIGALVDIEAHESDDDGFSSRHLEIVTTIAYEAAKLHLQHVVWAYPDAPGLRTQLRVKALPGFDSKAKALQAGDRSYKSYGGSLISPGARADHLPLDLALPNRRRYWGYYNDPGNRLPAWTPMLEEKVITGFPVFQSEVITWASGEAVEFDANGVATVKESPKGVNQPAHLTGAFFSGPAGVSSTGWGLSPEEFLQDRFRECWATWTVVYSGANDGLQFALKQFDAARYPVFPQRDMFILSNTWGPANPGGAQFTREDFLLTEIASAGKLGIDVVQIDDGWQQTAGGPAASNFLPKYTDGWDHIRAAAETAKVRMGLWVAIRNAKVADLKKDIDELGVATWKVDYDHLADRGDYEDRIAKYRALMKYAPMRTQFALCPEYDDPRYGWYFAREYGSIYFQNIQEGKPDHLTFVPFQVLRQHWLMAKYFPANKLQVMLQNPKRTRKDLSDAFEHSHAYCFAMGLPFVPVFFQSSQFLDDEGKAELGFLFAQFKKIQEDIFTSLTFPIGDEPSNASWSGFQMVSTKRRGGYLLLFRELHNREPQRKVSLKFLAGKTIRLTHVPLKRTSTKESPRTIRVGQDRSVECAILSPADFRLYRYDLAEPRSIAGE